MSSSPSVKEVVIEIFDQYKKFFEKTFSLCLLLTVIVFVAAALLFRFSNYDPVARDLIDSLLRCFYWRYSINNSYSIVDWSKSVYLAFIVCFAVSFFRAQENENELSPGFFLRNFSIEDGAVIFFTLVIVCALDPAIYFLDLHTNDLLHQGDMAKWVHGVLWYFRIYIPIVAFAFAVRNRIGNNRIPVSRKSFLVLLISVWMFNEFSYELMSLFRSVVIHFVTMFIKSDQTKFLVESVLGIPLLAFCFIGFAVVMCIPFKAIQPVQSDSPPVQ